MAEAAEGPEWAVRPREYAAELARLRPAPVDITGGEHPLLTLAERERLHVGGAAAEALVDPLAATADAGNTASASASTPAPAPAAGAPGITPVGLLEVESDPLAAHDPLSYAPRHEEDPLLSSLSASISSSLAASSAEQARNEALVDGFEPWSARRGRILARYTTSEKLSIIQMLPEGVTAGAAIGDKMRQRLELLEDASDPSVPVGELTQAEYQKRIDDLKSELAKAWDADQRVRSLKIAIQCAKLLADVSVIRYYPSKFVHITDILDTFGALVYERIRSKAEYTKPGQSRSSKLPEKFTPHMVPESAKETCRNWFYKIASIRELIPRLCVLPRRRARVPEPSD